MTNIPHEAPYGMEKELHLVKRLKFQCLYLTSVLPPKNMCILAIHTTYIRPLLQLTKLSYFRPQQIINTQLFFCHSSKISFLNFYPPLMFLVIRFGGLLVQILYSTGKDSWKTPLVSISFDHGKLIPGQFCRPQRTAEQALISVTAAVWANAQGISFGSICM